VRAIAFDLDGTSIERGNIMLPELVTRLAGAADNGIIIGTASGRPLKDQLEILSANGIGEQKGFPHFLIANEYEIYVLDGQKYEPLIKHNESIRKAWFEILPVAKSIIESELRRLTREGIFVKRNIPGEDIYQRGMIDLWFHNIQDAIAEEAFLNSLILEHSIPLICNRNFQLVQLLHARAGKGNTLKVAADYFKISPSNVLAIGDSSNDLSMLDGKLGFQPATVANADESIKRIVTTRGGYVASKPYGAGVIEIVDTFIFARAKNYS
jgi:HAD superfamily hydrolase (TIGR01484 family)